MTEKLIRIGAVADFSCRPLIYGIDVPTSPAIAGLSFDSPAVVADKLLADELDAGFIGPIDYARNSSDFSLYPSIGVSSRNDSRSVVLCLNPEIRKIRSVAVGVVSSSDIILGKIILSEIFEQDVSIVPVLGSVDEMLAKADSALLAGNALLASGWSGPRLDLVEEWTDMTDLPYVHLLCASRKDKQTRNIEELLFSARKRGVDSLAAIAATGAPELGVDADILEEQLGRYSYSFEDEDREGLAEFFRYSFYHGIIPDIPEIDVVDGK